MINKEDILQVITSCKRKIENDDYMSFDLFDALTCSWIDRLTKSSQLLRRIAIQINSRSPFDLHWLGMKKLQHTKTLSDMLWLNCILGIKNEDQLSNIEFLKNKLLERKTEGKLVWGLNFPYATRFIDASVSMPNLYNTCTVGIAITKYCEFTGKDYVLLSEMYSDLCQTFNYIKEGKKGFYIYYPGQKHPTYNVNALALFLFTRINYVSNQEIVPRERFEEILELIIDEQLPDGSWYYSRSEKGKWVDGFHTGFIIESLICTYTYGYKDDRLKTCIDRAIEYFINKMYTDDGFPKYFDYSEKYPIEAQNCAQAIQTLVEIKHYGCQNSRLDDLLKKVVTNTISTLYCDKSYFYYKKNKYYTNKASYTRWSTAPMLVALAQFYNLKSSE